MFNRFFAEHNIREFEISPNFLHRIEDREYWEMLPKEKLISMADNALEYSWRPITAESFMQFKANGNRKCMEDIFFERRNKLASLFFGEICENKGHFLMQIVNGLFATCEESYWGLSAHWYKEPMNIPTPEDPYIDLYVAETSSNLAMIYYILYDKLNEFCPEILCRVEYEIKRRVFEPYFAHTDYKWMGYNKKCNNWVPWIMSNLLTTFIVIDRDRERLEQAIEKMCIEVGHYYSQLPKDGGCDEGPGYWEHAGVSLFEFVYQLKLATGGKLDLFCDEKLKDIASYIKKVHIFKTYFANFADAHHVGLPNHMIYLYGFAKETKQNQLTEFAARVCKESFSDGELALLPLNKIGTIRRCLMSFLYAKEIISYKCTDLPLHPALEYLPNTEVATLRKDDLLVCIKGGHNHESHNHNDVGNFVFYDNGKPVIIDVGIGVYTRFTFSKEHRYKDILWTQSTYHNVPLINGTAQEYGDNFRTSSFSANEEKVELSFENAYPSDASIRSLSRSVSLTDIGILINDHVEFCEKENNTVEEHFMCISDVNIAYNCALIDNKYKLSSNCGEISAEYVPFNDPRLESDWNAKGVWRIKVKAKNENRIKIFIERL